VLWVEHEESLAIEQSIFWACPELKKDRPFLPSGKFRDLTTKSISSRAWWFATVKQRPSPDCLADRNGHSLSVWRIPLIGERCPCRAGTLFTNAHCPPSPGKAMQTSIENDTEE